MSTSRGSYADSLTDDFIGGAEERARQHIRTRSDQQVMLNVRVDPEMRRNLKRRAVDEDRPMRDIIVDALKQYLEQPQAEAYGFDDDGL